MKNSFQLEKRASSSRGLYRAGLLSTSHGVIKTPAFIPVATNATVKALSPEEVKNTGAQAVLANTYHLYLEPGPDTVSRAGELGKFMNWNGPTMTDSGGFQVFSLGAAFGKRISKFGAKREVGKKKEASVDQIDEKIAGMLARIDEDGVTFRSHRDGSEHRFTPEHSIQIQHKLGADIIFAFDECPSPEAPYEYQKQAMERTHRWAKRSIAEHKRLGGGQLLFGIVQGGRFEDLRKESARIVHSMEIVQPNGSRGGFDGFGIGGSFNKEDVGEAVRWVNEELPEEKPRHLLGIGEPEDLIAAIENGCDTFDCVTPTRMGRNGTLYTKTGKINIANARFREDFSPIENDCGCYSCSNYTKAYLSHLFRAEEMFAATLASIHNVAFIVRLTNDARQAILDGKWEEFRKNFMKIKQ